MRQRSFGTSPSSVAKIKIKEKYNNMSTTLNWIVIEIYGNF